MEVYKINLSSWTASFRYPNMISGIQPTLPVPPLSTINGLISSAMGKPFIIKNEKIAFVCFYNGKQIDLETIYQIKSGQLKGITSNVVKREFLSDVNLCIYTDSLQIAKAFEAPYFQILIGRSGDLATVDRIDKLEIKNKEELSNLKGTIIPLEKHFLPAPIQALPICFSETIPRKNISTKPYYLLSGEYRQKNSIKALGFSDRIMNQEVDIYWQEL